MAYPLQFETETRVLHIETRDVDEHSNSPSSQEPNISSTATGETNTATSAPLDSSTASVYTLLSTPSNETSTNSSQPYQTTSAHANGGHDVATAIGVVAILAVVTLLFGLLLCCLKRRGKLNKWPCFQPMTRSRRSSSSSRHVLEEHEVMENDTRPKPEGQSDDRFSIDDIENVTDPQEGREEYYYDEVFGQSQFEDEATNSAMRELYSNRTDVTEEEMLDLDFETLGIRITDYGPDIGRKNTV
ncbi:unnamed protein product [Candidula unifasciata]|uniref:Uncharacterized protein n=1 Tax=Candidula unifasciata TaxID=100452 RepID=A0A8S3YX65_9EUPU|nr:unnamed protein product [Candidula unifasciata]